MDRLRRDVDASGAVEAMDRFSQQAFDIVAATTGGNFGTSTIANQFFVVKFVQGRDGIGSAFAVLISSSGA